MRVSLRTTLLLLGWLAGSTGLHAQQAEAFQPGDVIKLQVEGDTVLTGTFTVGPGPSLTLPGIGKVPLAGVQRAELEPHLARELGRYLKDPVVHATALIRLSIVGEVAKPGIYAVPPDLVVADALMLAGGPTQSAKFQATRIERGEGGRPVVDEKRLQVALARGMTVQDLQLRPGDRIYVPPEARRDSESKWRIVGLVVTAAATVYGVIRLSESR